MKINKKRFDILQTTCIRVQDSFMFKGVLDVQDDQDSYIL